MRYRDFGDNALVVGRTADGISEREARVVRLSSGGGASAVLLCLEDKNALTKFEITEHFLSPLFSTFFCLGLCL